MKKNSTEPVVSDQSLKPRRRKSREVSSRFLSPSSTSSIDSGIPSPNQALSPIRRKPGTSTDNQKHRSLDEPGLTRGLWPSSTTSSSSLSQSSNKKLDTLADHLGNDRLKDLLEHKKIDKSAKNNNAQFVNRQRSCTELSRFENAKEASAKENHRPIIGGSMRHTGKLRFPGKSSSHSSSLVPGRLSVDENALSRKSCHGPKSDTFNDIHDSESECSDICSGTDFGSPAVGRNSSFSSSASNLSSTTSSRKSGIEVSSKYLNDLSTRPRRGTSDSNIPNPISSENSPKLNKFSIKNAIKRANSITLYGSTTSQWALSPGRSGSPPISVENKGKPMSFSSLKPPTSPSRSKGVGNLLNMGLELFKGKKSSSSSSSPLGLGVSETIHQLRLLQNRLIQWRYVNARADAVNGSIINQAETNLLHAWDSLTKLQYSVLQKKLQLEKEKLEMKLNFILHSQIKPLEAWGDIERQHLLAVSMTKDCLYSVVCRVPLIEGAKMDSQSASVALRHASDLTASIKSMLTTFSPSAEKTVSLLSELAEVVAQEKSLLEECFELFSIISTQEIQERSLKGNIIQLKLWQQHQQQQQQGIPS